MKVNKLMIMQIKVIYILNKILKMMMMEAVPIIFHQKKLEIQKKKIEKPEIFVIPEKNELKENMIKF